MNEYIALMIARKEQELMIQSLPPVSEFEGYVQTQQPGRASKLIGKLFQSVGSALTSVGERMSHEHDLSRRAPLSENG